MKETYILFITILFVAGCSSHNEQTLQCNEVNYVQEFPHEVNLEGIKPLPLNLVGCVDMKPADSLLIFKVDEGEYFWKIYSLNSNGFIADMLPRGHGDMEFASLPHSESVIPTDSALYCDFCDDARQTLFRCDLTRTLQQGRLALEPKFSYRKYEGAYPAVSLSDTSVYIKENVGSDGYIRFMLVNGERQDFAGIGNLNTVRVKENLNTLSAVTCINRKRMMAVEAMLRMNQINVYSLQSDSSFTICVGEKLDDVNEVDGLSKRMRRKYYGSVVTYDNYFVALYQGTSMSDYIQGKGKSSLQFFDWKGNPLLCIKLPMVATSFYIKDNSDLYVFSSMEAEEALYKYDCTELLKSIAGV
ncbi:MAG: hypothetical protein K2F69_00920 [Bacteroidaceae bacterium]|nr:hypothetical protein [Bacteroidaceae bacterium]